MHRPTRHALAPALFAIVVAAGAACSAGSTASGSMAVVPTATPSPASIASQAAASPTASPSTQASPRPSAIPLLGAAPTIELSGPAANRLQAVLDETVKGGAPAIVASVITADGTWSGAAGVVGPKGKPAGTNDVFSVASATKPIVAALMLRLAELGKVDLDAPLASFGLDPGVTNGATIRQALEMRGGLGETDASVIDRALADCAHAWTRDEVMAAFPKPVSEPGNRWFYSNPGYKLVGYAAEKVTGESLAKAIRTYVLDTAGVERMVLQGEDEITPKPWALPIDGHAGPLAASTYGTGGTLPCLSDSTLSAGGTAIAADAPSLAHWAWALFGGTIIDAESLATMTETTGDLYGLGIWKFDDFSPDTAYGHAGNKPGYAPIVVVFPKRQVVIALCINDQDADPFAPARRLLAALAG